MPRLTLIFADGDTVSLDAKPDEPLLQAAKRQGLALSSDCEVGDCQTCRARIVGGEVEYDEYATVSLSRDEIAAGEVLTCVASAVRDVAIRLPYARGALLSARPFTLRVEQVERHGAAVIRLQGKSLGLKPIGFLPGQYVNLRVPGTDHWRSYSMANAPNDGHDMVFLVRHIDGGAMSDYLADHVRDGDQIECRGPYGTFYLRDGDAPILMLAGGTGIAPMASMLRRLAAAKTRRQVTLCFGVNRPEDLFYVDELNALAASLDAFELRVSVVEGGTSAPWHSGHVTELVTASDTVGRDIYLCGPPAMTSAAERLLKSYGVDPARVFLERFISTGASDGDKAA